MIIGMPELTSFSDIEYLKNQLALNLSELEATNKFKLEIYNSLDDTFRRIDNLFHAFKRTTEKDKGKGKKSKDSKDAKDGKDVKEVKEAKETK